MIEAGLIGGILLGFFHWLLIDIDVDINWQIMAWS